MKNILVPIGSSKNAISNLQYAIDLASFIGDVNVYVISVFKEFYLTAGNPKNILLNSIEKGKKRYKETLMTSLPPLIVKPDDVWSFYLPNVSPNFITQKKITASVANSKNRDLISNAVVCIPSADPGFDWIFSKNISGLITKFGGAASHMAIRCAELGLPAAIGCGEILFNKLKMSSKINLNCKDKDILILEYKQKDDFSEEKKLLKSLGYIR